MCVLCKISYLAGGDPAASVKSFHAKPKAALDGIVARLATTSWEGEGKIVVSYGFRSSDANDSGFTRFTPQQIQSAEEAFALWSDVANIKFVRVGSGLVNEDAFSDNASILLSGDSTPDVAAYAWTFGPGARSAGSLEGDVFLNTSTSAFDAPSSGTFANMAIMHEIGHALGLSHPGYYNGGAPTYAANAAYAADSRQYTIMSYFSAAETGANHGTKYAATPLLHDIAAIQALYGANMSTRSGDTVYGFNSNTGRAGYFLLNPDDQAVFAVWDGGGRDTLDFSRYTNNQVINLNPMSFSNVGGLIGNVAIAKGAIIENAIGGSGDDQLVGNSAANVLRGGRGNDSADGRDGADTYVYDHGVDVFIGGNGADTIDFSTAPVSLLIDLRAGSAGAWIAPGGASNRADADRIAHLAGVENVRGTSGDDTIIGDSKANVIHGGAGRDAIEGGEGADTVSYAGAVRAVAVHLGKIDQSGADGDRIRSIENATGSAFDDHLVGSAGANALLGGRGDDRLTGGAGKDVLNGGVGDDWLYGGSGRDILTGGAGDDTFVFKSLNDSRGSGMDLISDFRRGQDHIDLSDFDAQTGRAGHQDFSFIGDTGFSQKAGQLRIEHDDYSGSKNDRTLIEGDTNGDGHADFMLAIKGLLALQASDFLF